MDKSEQYIKMCEKAEEIQNSERMWMRGGYERKPSNEELILGKMSFYAYTGEDGYYFFSNFAADYTWNSTVCGYVRIPERSFGCAVRDDLPVAYLAREIIWLPRQDQLQAMIGDYNECLDRLIGFSDMGIDRELEYYHQFTSFEQLWLAFVMADKEDKYWCWVEGDWVPHKVGVGEDLF